MFGQGDLRTDGWLLLAGPFTAVPLLLFASGARRVSMATLGLMQYLSPSIQFLLGICLYHEPFSTGRGAVATPYVRSPASEASVSGEILTCAG